MEKEIYEQPKAIADTIRGRIDKDGHVNLDELGLDPARLQEVDKAFVIACGTSYHAAMMAKYAIERWTRLPVEIDIASEFRYRDPVLDRRSLVIGISQSGETLDTLAAVRYARAQGATLIGVTNVVDSALAREADAVLYTRAGPEIGVAATKTFTTQLVAMQLLGSLPRPGARVRGRRHHRPSGRSRAEACRRWSRRRWRLRRASPASPATSPTPGTCSSWADRVTSRWRWRAPSSSRRSPTCGPRAMPPAR